MAQRYKERLLASNGTSSKQYESELGLKLLEKMGWNKGNGLGKNQQGRTDCIQVKRREEGQGLGKDTEEDKKQFKWNNNWWDTSYNSAANKVIGSFSNNINQSETETEEESESEQVVSIKKTKNNKSNNSKNSKLNKQALQKISQTTTTTTVTTRTRKYSQMSCSSAGSVETELLQSRLKKETKKIVKNKGTTQSTKKTTTKKSTKTKKTKSK